MLNLENINFGYQKKIPVLSNINWQIEDGECWGVLGHNGAGKTTLSYLVMGLISSENGVIHNTFDNYEYLPEFGGYYSYLTVSQNFMFKASLLKMDLTEDTLNALLRKIGLHKYKSELANRLSQGLKKRVAIGLMLISEADLYYFDEPTNGLDPEMLIILKGIILDLNNQRKTVIINSHNLEFIQEVTSNVLIINEGRITFNGVIDNIDINKLYMEKAGVNVE